MNKAWQAAEKQIWSVAASNRGPQPGSRAGLVVARRRFGFSDHQNVNKSKAPPLSAHSKFPARDIHEHFFDSLRGLSEASIFAANSSNKIK